MSCPFSSGEAKGGVCPFTGQSSTLQTKGDEENVSKSKGEHIVDPPKEPKKTLPKVEKATWRQDLERLQDELDGPCPVLKTGGIDFTIDVLGKKEIPLKNMARFFTVEDFLNLLAVSTTIDFNGKTIEGCRLRRRGLPHCFPQNAYIGDLDIETNDALVLEFPDYPTETSFTMKFIWHSEEKIVKVERIPTALTIENVIRISSKKMNKSIDLDGVLFARFAGCKSLLMPTDTLRSAGVVDDDVLEINIMCDVPDATNEKSKESSSKQVDGHSTSTDGAKSSLMSPSVLLFTALIALFAVLLNSSLSVN